MGFLEIYLSQDVFDDLTDGIRGAAGGLSRHAFEMLIYQQLREYISSGTPQEPHTHTHTHTYTQTH